MPTARELIEEAARYPIRDALARLNIPVRKVGSGLRSNECPSCGAGKKDSVRLAIDEAKNVWFCHVCESGGDPITLFRVRYGLSPLNAAKEILGVEDSDLAPDPEWYRRMERRKAELARKQKEQERQEAESRQAKAQIFTRLLEFCHGLKGDDFKGSLSYLENERAISRKVLRIAWAQGLIGFLPDEPDRTEAFLRSEFSTEVLLKSGLLREEGKRIGICFRPIVTPYRADNGQVFSAEFRYAQKDPDPKYGAKSIRYGRAPNPWIWAGAGNTTIVCEGIIDALSLRTMEFAGTIICVPGISQWRDEWNDLVTGQHVRVMFDNDAEPLKDKDGNPVLDEHGKPVYPGPKAAKRLVERLGESSRCLTAQALIPKRKGEDINDILLRRKAE